MNRRLWFAVTVAGLLVGVLCGFNLPTWSPFLWQVVPFAYKYQAKPPEYLDGPDLAWCVANDSSSYRMVIEPTGPERWHDVTLRVYDRDEEVFSWTGNPASPFARDGDKLYLADFHPIRTGCSVLAYDL